MKWRLGFIYRIISKTRKITVRQINTKIDKIRQNLIFSPMEINIMKVL